MGVSVVTVDSLLITIIYTILMAWGAFVGFRQIYQGFFRPNELLNPLFSDRNAASIFVNWI